MMDGPRTSPGRDGALSSPAERLRHAHILKRGRIGPASSPEGAKRSGAAAIARCAELGRFVQRSVGLWPLDDAGPMWPRAEMRACRSRAAGKGAAKPPVRAALNFVG